MKGLIVGKERGTTYVLDERGGFSCVPAEAGHEVGGELSLGESGKDRGISGYRKPSAKSGRMLERQEREQNVPVGAGRFKAVLTFWTNRKNIRKAKKVLNMAAVAACLVLITGGGIFANYWDSAKYTVYMDINPSVSFQVNSLNQIISSNAFNADGVELLRDVKPSGSVVLAIDGLVRVAESYITGEGVAITIATDEPEKIGVISNLLEESLSWTNIHVTAITSQIEQESLAKGVLPYRYALAKEASDADEDLDFETALNLKNSFLRGVVDGTEDYPLQ